MLENKINSKEFVSKILTGMSIGIVVALIPSALLGELGKALNIQAIVDITKMASNLLTVVMGFCIAMQFKMSPIQSGTLAITTMIGSGALKVSGKVLQFAGMGDVINAGITAAIAVLLILYIGDKLKAYTMLCVPTFVITLVGFIGLQILPYVSSITRYLGSMVDMFTTFQPVLMGIFISVTFAILIVSPVSTVGVAMAISLSGIGSGAANLGICAAGFGLAVAGFKVNGTGTSLAHVLGSPKMQMANFVKKPVMILPIISNAAIVGALGGIQKIQGTPMSAGFGISGLIGPINHLNIAGYSTGNLIVTVIAFVVVPLVLSFVFKYLFVNVLKIVKDEDYLIEFK
ncbi:regulator [Clostridium tetani]|uniref:PTS transporter subunit IIC n=1 Tax=Clostridium tetani TaxID=1513 RepID=UPI00100AE125|nr:PTS sugar transporter subunit IIC [Clostridium tetani]RXI40043.1 regulator [Clostridium tetani]